MSGSLEFKIDDKAVRHAFALALARQDPELSKALHRVGELVRDEAKHRAPVGHPRRSSGGKTLAESIVSKMLANRVIVRSSKRYAAIQEFGGHTGPHIIRARKAGALAFNGIVVKSVHHPGGTIRARHYLWGALKAKEHEVERTIEHAVDTSLKALT